MGIPTSSHFNLEKSPISHFFPHKFFFSSAADRTNLLLSHFSMAQYSAKMLASLTIGAREWVWPAVLIFTAGAALAIWGYARVNASRSTRVAGLLLRIIGLAALTACLVDPMWTATQP